MSLPGNLKIKLIIVLAFFCINSLFLQTTRATEVSGIQIGRWGIENSPYIVTGNIEVPENSALIIEPGVIVKFSGYYSINVRGTLQAIGNVGKRIVFTSAHDKEFGIMGPFTTMMPTKIDWSGIDFASSSENQSKLDYCIIRYSDKAISASLAKPGLTNIIIADCSTNNIQTNGRSVEVLEGGEKDYTPIEATLDENLLFSAMPKTTIEEPKAPPSTNFPDSANQKIIFGEVGAVLAEKEFTFGEITVISAARKEQRISEAPAAITVITDEDIRYSGAITIPDILRMVPGMDVMQISASDLVINARGYNKEMSNKMLVLIDGRHVYWDFYGIILWDSFPISLEDISRIEIIRGAGSALYGANAFSGIVNIITKSPEESKGTHVSANGGNFNTYIGSIIHAGSSDKYGYKISLGLDETNQWPNGSKPSRDVKRIQGYLEYKMADSSKILFEAGFNKGHGETLSGIGRMNREQKMAHVKLGLNLKNFSTKTFWSRSHGDALQEPALKPYFFISNTYDIESQFLFNLGTMNSVILGGNYRLNIAESDLIDEDHRQNLFASYIQDEFKPSERLAITIGLRYDIHPLVKEQFSPRANILISPFKEHHLRLSYGTAFRNPSFIESYLYENSDISSMISPLLPPNSIIVQARGNSDLLPEKITSYEIGYQALLKPKFRVRLDLFYNNLEDFIAFKTIRYQDVSPILEYPAGSIIVPGIKSYTNAGKSKAIGGEFGIEFITERWLRAVINYSYQKLTCEEDDPLTPENEKNQPIKFSPRNKINGNIRINFDNGLSANFLVHYVGKTEKNETWAFGKVDAYTLVNLRLGYRFLRETTEMGLTVYNLFDKKHFEYPGTNIQGDPSGAYQIGRRITGIFLSRSL